MSHLFQRVVRRTPYEFVIGLDLFRSFPGKACQKEMTDFPIVQALVFGVSELGSDADVAENHCFISGFFDDLAAQCLFSCFTRMRTAARQEITVKRSDDSHLPGFLQDNAISAQPFDIGDIKIWLTELNHISRFMLCEHAPIIVPTIRMPF